MIIKKYIPLAAAITAAVILLLLMQKPPDVEVVVASRDLVAGHRIIPGDLRFEEIPERLLPVDAVYTLDQLAGQTLAVDRSKGDLITMSHLGEPIMLGADERAVAIAVQDSSGLAGLLQVGDMVGVNAVIYQQDSVSGTSGIFSKTAVEDLQVLYMSPNFTADNPGEPLATIDASNLTLPQEREDEGTVVLAVPVAMTTILYDFSSQDTSIPNAGRQINAIELLSALDHADNAFLSLYLMPDGAQEFTTSGLWMPDLVITAGPTPTPTETPYGYIEPTAVPEGETTPEPEVTGTPGAEMTPTPGAPTPTTGGGQ